MNLTVHPWIGSNPLEQLDQFKKSAFNWNLASTITTIAMGAISFSIVYASFVVTVPMSIMILSLCVISPALSFVTSYFRENAILFEQKIFQEEPVAIEFDQIKSWDDSKILSFLTENNIEAPENISLFRFLPVIARYIARCNEANFYSAESQKLLNSEDVQDRSIRLWQRLKGWRCREEVVLPARIEAAYALAVLRNPTLPESFSSHFTLVQKEFAERFLSKTYDKEDIYLKFNTQDREPLSFDELYKISDPKAIYELLYS